MRCLRSFIILFFTLASCLTYAVEIVKSKKLPFALLSDDHGVLSEADFKDERIAKAPYKGELTDDIYWQCFPRDAITVELQELGYSSEDIGWDDNYSSLMITAVDLQRIQHKYTMRRMWPISGTLEKFKTFLRLMKNEKTVCIAGSAPFQENINSINKPDRGKEILWTFEQLKTKKGCDSYFLNACASTVSTL